jgi:hypothetical protein
VGKFYYLNDDLVCEEFDDEIPNCSAFKEMIQIESDSEVNVKICVRC